MFSGKVLIFALTLTYMYLAVFASTWDCENTECNAKDIDLAGKYLKAKENCKDKKDIKTCENSCKIIFASAQPVGEVTKRKCDFENLDKIEDEEDKNCCTNAMKYFENCKKQYQDKNPEP